MQTQIDLNALADYALNTFDCSEQFEDDAFGFSFDGQRLHAERKCAHFIIHVGTARHQLPR